MSTKYLVLVESPTKQKTIREYLPSNYTVVASVGHISEIRDGGKYYNTGINPQERFDADFAISQDKKEIVARLTKLVKDSDVVWHISTFDCELVIGFGIDAMLVSTKYNIPLAELFAGKKIDVSDYTVRCQLAKWWQSEERCPGVITCNQLFDEVRQIF